MTWNKKYWGLMESLFWVPSKLGLASIPKHQLERAEDHVRVPRKFVNPNGPLYRRVQRETEAIETLRRSEEPLNDILDLAFAIAADEIVAELLFEPLGLDGQGPITSVGGLDSHFGREMHNITQHDGFYVTPHSVMCLEVKLGARSSLEQVAKYAFLFREEERRAGVEKQLGLMFLVPQSRKASFERSYGEQASGDLAKAILERAGRPGKKKPVYRKIAAEPEVYADILSRVRIRVLAWADLVAGIDRVVARATDAPGDQTIVRLLVGTRRAIEENGGTEVERPPA